MVWHFYQNGVQSGPISEKDLFEMDRMDVSTPVILFGTSR
jgi:hypothetical protein